MKNPVKFLRFVSVGVLLFLALIFAKPALADNDEATAVQDVLLKSASGFEQKDLALLSQVWANDDSLTVYESGYANYGWTDYRDNHLVPEMNELKNTSFKLADVHMHVSGQTAWATFKYSISADLPDRHVDGGGLGTAILEKRNGRWVIVHWHSSSPRKESASKEQPAPKKKD